MKNNLIKDPLLPSASGRPGHTRQRSAACGWQTKEVFMSNFGKRQETHSFLSQTLSRPSLWPLLHISGAQSHESTSQDWSKFWVCPHAQLLHGKYAFSTQIPRLERLSLAAELRIPKPLPACRCLAHYSQKNMARCLSKLSQKAQKNVNISEINILDFQLKIKCCWFLVTRRDSWGFSWGTFQTFCFFICHLQGFDNGRLMETGPLLVSGCKKMALIELQGSCVSSVSVLP